MTIMLVFNGYIIFHFVDYGTLYSITFTVTGSGVVSKLLLASYVILRMYHCANILFSFWIVYLSLSDVGFYDFIFARLVSI